MQYVAKITNNGEEYWLKGTTWTFTTTRADKFDSIEKAQAGLERARKFTQPKLFKTASILAL